MRRKINTEYVRPSLTPEEIERRKQLKRQLGVQKPTETEIQPKPLFIILQKQFFDEILAGTKKIEYREGSDFYYSRFMNKDATKFKRYETVIFQNGYNKNARRMTVVVRKIEMSFRFKIFLGEILDKNF